MKVRSKLGWAVVGILTQAGPALAAQPAASFDLPAQSLAESLRAVGSATNTNILFDPPIVRALQAPALKGLASTEEALTRLLSGTGITYEFMNANTVVVGADDVKLIRLSQQTSSEAAANPQAPPANEGMQLDEIVVTAQKKEERLQDVPVPVTSVNARNLATQGQVLLRDYFATVPGLNVAPTIQSNQTVSIRGITTGTGNPTVSILVDDVPYGASTNVGGGRFIPEVDPGDLARIEVLRGPQGTLYGASSLGGLLKFVTSEPTLDRRFGSAQAGVSDVKNGDGAGYSVRGSLNLPLSDTWAARVSGFKRREAGYVDNVRTGEDGVNRNDADGGRLAVLWAPSDTVSLKLNALSQKLTEDGQASVDIGLPDLEQSRTPGTGWSERKTQSYTATLNVGLGRADLVSLTGYTVNKFSGSTDFGAEILGGFDGKKFTQEVRLNMPLGERFEWLAGLFYTNEDSELLQTTVSVDPVTAERLGVLSETITPTRFKEYAAFTDLTMHVTERFDVQFGLREARIRQTFNETVTAGGALLERPTLHPKANAFTYLVTPQLNLFDDVMIYGRLASGYRPGGANPTGGGIVPFEYEPDKTLNYEVGLKGDFLSGRLTLDGSVYRIDWKDIQFNLLSSTTPPVSYTTNGSRARSQGVELAAGIKPMRGLSISGWVSWNDAELTQSFPPASTALGASGDRLPFSSRFAAHLSAEQDFPLWRETMGYVGATLDRVGERIGPFRAVAERQVFPAYTQVNLRAGVRRDGWTVGLFCTNLGDKRGALSGGLGGLPATALIYIRPRTIGVSLTKDFE